MRTLIFAVCLLFSAVTSANDVVTKTVPLVQSYHGLHPVLVAILDVNSETAIQIENANMLPISCVFANEYGEMIVIGVGEVTRSPTYVFQGIFKHEHATCSLQYRS